MQEEGAKIPLMFEKRRNLDIGSRRFVFFFACSHFKHKHNLIQETFLDFFFETNSCVSICENLDTFKAQFDAMTGLLFDGLNWDNIFVAGGSVVASVLPIPKSYGMLKFLKNGPTNFLKKKTREVRTGERSFFG